MSFPEKLTKLREEHHMTPEELAEKLGVSAAAVRQWEAGLSMPDLPVLVDISTLLEIRVYSLVIDEDEEEVARVCREIGLKFDTLAIWEGKADPFEGIYYEDNYESRFKIFGIPLLCIRFSSVTNPGCVARGIIAVGNIAVGVFAFGTYSAGVISIGAYALGLFTLGGLAFGIVTVGAAAVGFMSFGILGIGVYAGGIVAIGTEIAVGVMAAGKMAIGRFVYSAQKLQYYRGITSETVQNFILWKHPRLWKRLLDILVFLGTNVL